MKFLRVILLSYCCFICSDLFAQNPKAIEADLLKSYKKIFNWYQKARDTTDAALAANDSLTNVNDVFAKKLKYYAERFPSTIVQPFNSLRKEELDISTSTDNMFRIYSWDTWTGGTTHFFESVIQYRSGTGFKTIIDTPKSEGDVRPNYRKVYTLKANDKAFYISTYLYVFSTKDDSEGVHIFTIENGKLIDAKLIKTQSGLHNDLSYDYDFSSVVQIDYDKRPRPRFDEKANIIYLPLVDGNHNMTNKFIQYKFNGQYFERVKN